MGSIMSHAGVHSLSGRRGLSVLEVLFALAVILTGVGTTLATWSKANAIVARNQAEAFATSLLQQKLDEIGRDELARVADVREDSGQQTVTISRLGALPYVWSRTVKRHAVDASAVSVHCVVEWSDNSRSRRVEASRAFSVAEPSRQVAAR